MMIYVILLVGGIFAALALAAVLGRMNGGDE